MSFGRLQSQDTEGRWSRVFDVVVVGVVGVGRRRWWGGELEGGRGSRAVLVLRGQAFAGCAFAVAA